VDWRSTTCSRDPSGIIASTNAVDMSIRRLDVRSRATTTRPGSSTQNYFPAIDRDRSATKSAIELGLCGSSSLVDECRD
jgi:hypothetical protein